MNGEQKDVPGTKVDPQIDRVTCGGQEVRPPDACTYVLLNKPRGYLVSTSDTQHDRTIFSLLSDLNTRVFPVGRLDMDTGGALLLTNDGDLAYRLTHPSYGVDKAYRVGVSAGLSSLVISKLENGVVIDGRKTSQARVRVLGSGPGVTEIEIVIHEGRNRQIRKMCEAVGCPAVWLERFAFAGMTVDDLGRGAYRHLTRQEVCALQELVQLGETN
ncbi:MAG: pseudouridine synthase [Candidatus Latescibacterota bacterium]|nr:pseudouridine synthase [Candidatus Latescibacterota bacterium]